MQIGELARRCAVSVRLLRYYEEQGLLHPGRTAAGYRTYTSGDVETVRRIRQLLAAGLPTAIIAEVLPCLVVEGRDLVPACADLVAKLRHEQERIDATVDRLLASRRLLQEVIDRPVPASQAEAVAEG